jgi:hypothetical protein
LLLFAGGASGRIESGTSDLDLAAEDACARLSGGGWRETAVAGGERRRSSPAITNSGSRTRFEVRIASTCGARVGEASRGGESGGHVAERRDDAEARKGNSCEVARATG